MPETRRPDRLARDELQALQQKALREWRASDWLAAHEPRAYQRIEEQDAGEVRIDLGGGVGDAEQEPGYVVLGDALGGPTLLAERTGEHRQPDIAWSLASGRLPFEDQTVDRYCLPVRTLRHLPEPAFRTLPAELARTLTVGGEVHLKDGDAPGGFTTALQRAGFVVEEAGTWVLTQQTTPLVEAAPLQLDDKVLGETRIPTVRQPRSP